MNFVVTFVEVVELFELVVGISFDSNDLFDVHLGFDHAVRVTLIEWEHFFFLSLQLSAELCRLQDLLTKMLVLSECLHAFQRVTGKHANVPFFFVPLLGHILLELLVVVVDLHLLGVEFAVALGELAIVLLDLELPVDLGVAEPLNSPRRIRDLSRQLLVLLEFLLITLSRLLRLRRELVVVHLELLIELLDLPDEDELHAFQFLNVSVLGLLTQGVVLGHHLLELGVFFVFDGVDHLGEFFGLEFVTFFDVSALLVILSFYDLDVSEELFMQSSQTTLLE